MTGSIRSRQRFHARRTAPFDQACAAAGISSDACFRLIAKRRSRCQGSSSFDLAATASLAEANAEVLLHQWNDSRSGM
eukprot:scaffold260996_cov33-Tisochrysis_lutea.AAC.1